MIEKDISDLLQVLIYDTYLVALIGGTVAGLLVKFLTVSRSEKVFQYNRKKTLNFLFSKISYIDSYKQTIYKYWENHEYYKNSNSMIVLETETYKEIMRFRELIFNSIKEITLYKKSPYLMIDDYLVMQQYAFSAYTHIHEIGNLDNGIGINNKELEFHRYYAKLIIEKFKKSTPNSFRKQWNIEFNKVGGIQFIVEPQIEPGDIITAHYNLQNELLNYDAQYSSIMKLLREIKEILKNKDNDDSK